MSRPPAVTRASALLATAALLAGCVGSVDEEEAPDTVAEAPTETAPALDDSNDAPEDVDDAAETPADDRPPLTGEAPRADVPIYPGAELVHEQFLEAAVEEVWAVDAPLDEVISFYAELPDLEQLPGSAVARDDGGGYLELEIFSLVRQGVTDPAEYEAAAAAAEYGPLLRIAVVTRESSVLTWFGGEAGREAVPAGNTVILFNVLTG